MSFSYDVAISAVGYDAATAQRLTDRLRPRLSLPVFSTCQHQGAVTGEGVTGLAARVLGEEARVVVVLHQRLWGATPSTRLESEAIEQRVSVDGAGFLHVIALEPAEPPAWMPPVQRHDPATESNLDAIIDAVVAAVVAAGGSERLETLAQVEARAARQTDFDRERGYFFRSSGGTAASVREFTSLVEEMERELAERCPKGSELVPQVYRAPDRLIVQLGGAGLSVSRMRSSTGVAAEASLLVIEWQGTVTRPGSSRGRGERATPLRERVLHGDAAKTTSWQWRDGDPGQRVYSSRDLAAECVHLLVRQAEQAGTADHAAA